MCSPFFTIAQDNYAGYLGAQVTLTNTDTAKYEVAVNGAKANVSIQVNVGKLTGTVAGKIDIYGSVDGVTYETALATASVSKADASANYVIKLTNNAYKKYRIWSISSGTNTHTSRVYLLYRKAL